jgi:hemoglobin
MKLDISSRKDIKSILSEFYNKLLMDEKMLPFFEEIICNNQLEHHLEIITDFWEDILFDTTLYKNNAMQL